MTVNAFLEFFNFENSIQSSEKINYRQKLKYQNMPLKKQSMNRETRNSIITAIIPKRKPMI